MVGENMKKKYTKEELFRMNAIDVYKMVLKGDVIKRFPKGFWEQPEAKQNSIKCIHYLMDELLVDILWENKLNSYTFRNNKLSGMFKLIYDNSVYNAIESAYPGKFKPWDMPMTSFKYWNNLDNCKNAVIWLIEEKLEYNEEDIKKKLSYKTFREHGLGGLSSKFNNNIYELLNLTYPNKFKRKDICSKVPKNFYSDKNIRVQMIRDMIENLSWSEEDIKTKLTYKTFVENGLSTLICEFYNYKVVDAIKEAYPGLFDNYNSTSFKRNKPIKE